MKAFMDENFLLESPTAETLYHEFAKNQPIIDYHCHLPPDEIAGNRQFENLSAIWLHGDHYKWRAMRTLGVDEKFITGRADDRDKFRAWAQCVPQTMRNPLYHWTHLELKRYFGVTETLSEKNADTIYDKATEMLQQDHFRVHSLLDKMNVKVVCTTDDPTDDLKYHEKIKGQNISLKVLPAFRPDKCLAIEKDGPFISYIENLGNAANSSIRNLDDLYHSLDSRMSYFHERGCRLSDHGLIHIHATDFTDDEADQVLQKKLAGDKLTEEQMEMYRSAVLHYLGKKYHEYGWVQQFHLGALRNNNMRMESTLGPDTGFDSIGDWRQASQLSQFLNNLDATNQLSKTILYNLNPNDNATLATMIGNFNDGSSRGKMQFGSGWWFLDQKHGMEDQMNTLSNMGILSCFVGMLTDSRSFMSFPRHEYFRRILCNLFGRDVENGELPNELDTIGKIIGDICYRNAEKYFDF